MQPTVYYWNYPPLSPNSLTEDDDDDGEKYRKENDSKNVQKPIIFERINIFGYNFFFLHFWSVTYTAHR